MEYHALYYDDLELKLVLGFVVFLPLTYFFVRHRRAIFCERSSYSAMPTGKIRGFAFIVRQTAAQFEQKAASCASAAEVKDPSTAPPPEPDLFQVHAPESSIVHKKSGDRVHGTGASGRSILSIAYVARAQGGGWSLKGTRREMDGKQRSLYAIKEGLRVASTGKSYWLERNSKVDILVVGTWRGDAFEGEWLSSTGKRGPYGDCTRIEKGGTHLYDTAVQPVSPCSGDDSLNTLCREAAGEP
jgi:hypothetical protein